jgi:hypothetical protein
MAVGRAVISVLAGFTRIALQFASLAAAGQSAGSGSQKLKKEKEDDAEAVDTRGRATAPGRWLRKEASRRGRDAWDGRGWTRPRRPPRAALAVHKEAHGLMPDTIEEVSEGR